MICSFIGFSSCYHRKFTTYNIEHSLQWELSIVMAGSISCDKWVDLPSRYHFGDLCPLIPVKFVGLNKDEFLGLVPGTLPHHRVQVVVPSMKFIQWDLLRLAIVNAYLSRHCFPLRLELCTFSPKTSAMRVHFFVPWSLTRSTIRLSSYIAGKVRYLLNFQGKEIVFWIWLPLLSMGDVPLLTALASKFQFLLKLLIILWNLLNILSW